MRTAERITKMTSTAAAAAAAATTIVAVAAAAVASFTLGLRVRWELFVAAAAATAAAVALMAAAVWALRAIILGWLRRQCRAEFHVDSKSTVVAFYHPFCASGGGGERVLWRMLATMQDLHAQGGANVHVLIYASDQGKSRAEILRGAKDRFDIDLLRCQRSSSSSSLSPMGVDIVFLPKRLTRLLDPEAWPRLTMVGQTLGSVAVSCYALVRATPDTFIDTTGAAFAIAAAKILASTATAAYVHYVRSLVCPSMYLPHFLFPKLFVCVLLLLTS